MIARLHGRLRERAGEEVVVDVGGVGYQVYVSAQTLAALPAAPPPRRDGAAHDVGAQAVSALVNLGFRPVEADQAVDAAIAAGVKGFEEVVREALRSTRR